VPNVLVEVRVDSLGLDPTSDVPVVVLREVDGERLLPIWIGHSEAHAIGMEMRKKESQRPLSADLLTSVVREMGGEVERIIISRVEANTYFAEMIIRRDGETVSLDARPSDSIAVALRTDARIMAEEELFADLTLEVAGDEGGVRQGMSPDELQAHLERLNPQDFGRFQP
jgi:uncharacterized protein